MRLASRDFNTDKPIILHRVNNACKSIIVVKHQEQNIYYVEDYLLISQSSMLEAKKFQETLQIDDFLASDIN